MVPVPGGKNNSARRFVQCTLDWVPRTPVERAQVKYIENKEHAIIHPELSYTITDYNC